MVNLPGNLALPPSRATIRYYDAHCDLCRRYVSGDDVILSALRTQDRPGRAPTGFPRGRGTQTRRQVMSETTVVCMECGRMRADDDPDYSPMQIFTRQPFGWYSGDDGELCGACFTEIFERGNEARR